MSAGNRNAYHYFDIDDRLDTILVRDCCRGLSMLRTVILGSCISVQGIFVRDLPDGRVQVRVGKKLYSGVPVKAAA